MQRYPVTRVISFTSGKGGVGKTTTVLNTATALAAMGRSVLVLDADLGLANVDVMLGVQPKYTLHDVLEGKRSMADIIIDVPAGISIIPASSGVERMCQLSHADRLALIQSVEEVALEYDYLFVDTQAGIGPDVIHFNTASNEIVCVITAEPTSLTDAYALIKILSRNYGERRFSIIANNVVSEQRGEMAFKKLQGAVDRFLHVQLDYLGAVPSDSVVPEAIIGQRPFVSEYPSSVATRAISLIAKRIDREFVEMRVKGGIQFFFKQLLEVSAGGIA